MTQKFKLATDDLEENLKASNDNSPHGSFAVFTEGKSPSIDFQLSDGTSQFLRYIHMLHGDYSKGEQYDKIKLLYSTHTVVVEGYCLSKIYDLVKQDTLSSVRENDERFMHSVEEEDPFVTKIEIIWRKQDMPE